MELQNVLNNRRSMRNYDAAKKVTKEQVERLNKMVDELADGDLK